eukprot:8276-Heterococcus_DN1.PRE.1
MRLAQAGAHSTVLLFVLSVLGALLAEALRLDSMHSRARALQRSWQLCAAAKRPSSQFRGVRPRAGGRWDAAITAGGTRTIVGNFSSEQEAARAYDAAARELHGAAAKLNFQTDATAGVANTNSNTAAAAATAAAATAAAADSFGFADLEDTRLLNSLWGAESDGSSSSALQSGQAAAEADTTAILQILAVVSRDTVSITSAAAVATVVLLEVQLYAAAVVALVLAAVLTVIIIAIASVYAAR